MCPPEYKLPTMRGPGHAALGRLLEYGLEQKRESVEDQQQLLKPSDDELESMPPSAYPEVPAQMLQSWSTFFDNMDINSDARLTADELARSGLASHDVCHAITDI